MVAIIASLLVISAYVALRFEWKFAVPVLIALMHDLLITSGVYALTGREVTTATVAALLTILGYSLYDTIIVFDRVRENIPRMPRAAFSQIVNRSMSEVLTRSLATTSCTLMPILALLLFGGGDAEGLRVRAADRRRLRRLLVDLHRLAGADALEGARAGYRARRHRIEEDLGYVPAYAADRRRRRAGRASAAGVPAGSPQPDPETVSAAEFEQMKRDLEIEREVPGRHTSTLTKRLPQQPEAAGTPARQQPKPRRSSPSPPRPPEPRPRTQQPAAARTRRRSRCRRRRRQRRRLEPRAPAEQPTRPSARPDIAENEGVAPVQQAKRRAKSRPRNRRHGRRS